MDKQTNTLVITRNNPAPVLLVRNEALQVLDDQCTPVGLHRDTRPVISEVELEPGLIAVMYTDGLVHAGSRRGENMDVIACLEAILEEEEPSPQMIADDLLETAVRLDEGRPSDDISVVVLCVTSHIGDNVRRMSVRLPLDS